MLVDQKSFYREITEQDYAAMAGPDWPDYDSFSKGVKIPKFIADEIDTMLNQVDEKRKELSSFCVLPFYGMEYPTKTHCCLLPMNYDIDRIRADMLNNRRTPDCHKCWHLEDAGNLSDRQIKNFTLDFYSGSDLLYLYEQARSGDYNTTHYKIDASNFCNATCVTCGSLASTAWGDLERDHLELAKEFRDQTKPTKNLYFIKKDDEKIQFDYATAKFVSFRGGESTMIRAHWDIVEKIIEVGNTDCCISFVTNGSFNLTQRQKTLLEKLKSVNFCFSVDGIGKVFEYMRFPLSWEKIVSNIKWCQDAGYLASVSYTVSNLNILYHEQTTQWFDDNGIPYIRNTVYDPEYFSPRSLSYDVKQKILKNTNDNTVKFLLSDHNETDQKNYGDFLKQIKYQDLLKKISINDYLPEVADLIQLRIK